MLLVVAHSGKEYIERDTFLQKLDENLLGVANTLLPSLKSYLYLMAGFSTYSGESRQIQVDTQNSKFFALRLEGNSIYIQYSQCKLMSTSGISGIE